jgi:amino acid transporter
LVIGYSGTAIVGALHYRGAASAIRFQNFVTLTFIGVMILLIALGATFGTLDNLRPIFRADAGQSVRVGILWVFSTSAFFLNGWQTALHAIEERGKRVSVKVAVWHMAAGILAGAFLYCGIVLAARSEGLLRTSHLGSVASPKVAAAGPIAARITRRLSYA